MRDWASFISEEIIPPEILGSTRVSFNKLKPGTVWFLSENMLLKPWPSKNLLSVIKNKYKMFNITIVVRNV